MLWVSVAKQAYLKGNCIVRQDDNYIVIELVTDDAFLGPRPSPVLVVYGAFMLDGVLGPQPDELEDKYMQQKFHMNNSEDNNNKSQKTIT